MADQTASPWMLGGRNGTEDIQMSGAKQLDAELMNLVYRFRTPLYWVTRRRYVPRVEPAELAESINSSLDMERDPIEAFNQASNFRASGLKGLYGMALMQAGVGGHPVACICLAGIMVQRAVALDCTNRRSLLARAIGWLSYARADQFDEHFGGLEKQLQQISAANAEMASGAISATRRAIDRAEGKATVVQRKVARAELKNLGEARYQRLNSSFALKGEITAVSKAKIIETLSHEYPWATDLISEIDRHLTLGVSADQPHLTLPPMLIVGPPGVGKTRFARRLSELTSVPHAIVNAAGATDNRDFSGTARGWASAHPSRVVEFMIDADCANPIVIVDEIDKFAGGPRNGNIPQTLLAMLAPETCGRFRDEGLNVEIDLSHVNWILTANDTRNLDWPLLTRLKTVTLPLPAARHAEGMVNFILIDAISKMKSKIHIDGDLEPEIRDALVRAARSGATPRTIAAMVERSIAIKMQWQRKKLH